MDPKPAMKSLEHCQEGNEIGQESNQIPANTQALKQEDERPLPDQVLNLDMGTKDLLHRQLILGCSPISKIIKKERKMSIPGEFIQEKEDFPRKVLTKAHILNHLTSRCNRRSAFIRFVFRCCSLTS